VYCEFFTLQQDNASAHCSRETVGMLSCETPDFITPLQWLPNTGPHYSRLWNLGLGLLQERVYCSRMRTSTTWWSDSRLTEKWCDLDHIIDVRQ